MIVGRVILVDYIRTEAVVEQISEQEYTFGDFGPARWAWRLEKYEEFENPIPIKGAFGIWEFRESV